MFPGSILIITSSKTQCHPLVILPKKIKFKYAHYLSFKTCQNIHWNFASASGRLLYSIDFYRKYHSIYQNICPNMPSRKLTNDRHRSASRTYTRIPLYCRLKFAWTCPKRIHGFDPDVLQTLTITNKYSIKGLAKNKFQKNIEHQIALKLLSSWIW